MRHRIKQWVYGFWSSYGQDGSGYGVYYQKKYDQNAYKISIEKQLNTFTSGDQGYVNLAYEISGRPRAVSTSDDKVIVTWVSNGQDGSAGGVYFSILDSNGNKIVQESLVNTYINDWQMLPQIQVFLIITLLLVGLVLIKMVLGGVFLCRDLILAETKLV